MHTSIVLSIIILALVTINIRLWGKRFKSKMTFHINNLLHQIEFWLSVVGLIVGIVLLYAAVGHF